MTDPPRSPSGPALGKRALRRAALARRDAIMAEDRARAAAEIAARVNALLDRELAAGGVVALYAAKGSEVDTAAIEAHAVSRGLRVVYPRVIGRALALTFHVASSRDLVPAPFGLREPAADAPVVAPRDVTAFVVPGLAFDRRGGRVGWGQGHYDATFEAAPAARRIGVAFEQQIVETIEREPHDVALHYVVTEVATYAVE